MYIDISTKEKDYCNQLVCDFAHRHLPDDTTGRNGICLDASKLRTSAKWVQDKLISPERITIVEKCRKTHAAQKQNQWLSSQSERPRFFQDTMTNFLNNHTSFDIQVAFFDYMGDYFGNISANLFPQQDLFQFLRKNKSRFITLAFTVCLDPRAGAYFVDEGREVSVIDQFVNNVVPSSKYTFAINSHNMPDIQQHVYRSRRLPMLFVCCNLVLDLQREDDKLLDQKRMKKIRWPYDERGWCGFSKDWQDDVIETSEEDDSEEENSEEENSEEDDSEDDDERHPLWFHDDTKADPNWR